MPYTKLKALERSRLEEEREDVLDALVMVRRRSRRNRLLLQLVEIDGALDDSYNADDAARDFDRMWWNSRVFNEMNSTSPFAFMLTVSRIDRHPCTDLCCDARTDARTVDPQRG